MTAVVDGRSVLGMTNLSSTNNQAEERATWFVSMWLDGNYDGEATCRETERQVNEACEESDAADGGNIYLLAEQFRQRATDHVYGGHNVGGSLPGDFLDYMLACVDWYQLAGDRITDYVTQQS